MKHVIYLMESGGSIGFTIPDNILDDLELNLHDSVEVEIFKEYGDKPSFVITPRLRLFGGSKGVTIRFYLVNELSLESGQSYQADIRRPQPKKD